VQGSDFVVEQGKITALIGPNGAGKTTLFDIICGLVKQDEGNVLFNDADITGLPVHERMNLGISRTFQQVRLFTYLTIADHLQMTEDNEDMKLFKNFFAGKKTYDRKKFQQVLDEFGIERELDAQVSDLSYGQRKLLDFAMAERKAHQLLMLDEPVAGVNAVIQERIENRLLLLKEKGETVLLIDHDMRFIRRLADHVIVLDAGKVIVQGEPKRVLEDERVLRAYLGE